MFRPCLILAASAVLSACALAPDRAEPGWSDALLAETPAGDVPASVSSEPLDPDIRRDLLNSALQVQRQGLSTREIGVALRAPSVDTAAFVVEARERARPPDPQ